MRAWTIASGVMSVSQLDELLEKLRLSKATLEVIQETLIDIDYTMPHILYYHFELSCGLKKEQIPENPELFLRWLRIFFGEGAKFIETRMTHNLSASRSKVAQREV